MSYDYHNNMNSWHTHISMYSSSELREMQKYIHETRAAVSALTDQALYYGTGPYADRRRNRTW